MFTGLVQAVGSVAEVRPTPAGVRFLVDPRGWDHRPAPGESISVSGCCLTLAAAVETTGGHLAFDVIPETLSKTSLGALRPGSGVNLERSLRPADLMGGHVVQGHVDGLGTIERVQTGGDCWLYVRPPADLMPYLVPKGSIAIDGVSLTVASVDPAAGTFGVALIPTTLALTTLASLRAGDRVNLEADVLAKTIVHYLRHYVPQAPGNR